MKEIKDASAKPVALISYANYFTNDDYDPEVEFKNDMDEDVLAAKAWPLQERHKPRHWYDSVQEMHEQLLTEEDRWRTLRHQKDLDAGRQAR